MNEPQSPDMRIGDTERENALKALGEHMSVGRLDIDEYGDRSAKVTTARTRAELLAVFTDLPDPKPVFDAAQPAQQPPSSVPAPVEQPQVPSPRPGFRGFIPGELTGPVVAAAWLSAVFLSGPLHVGFLWPVAIGLTILMGPLTRRDRSNDRRQRHEDRRERHRERRELRRGDR